MNFNFSKTELCPISQINLMSHNFFKGQINATNLLKTELIYHNFFKD